MKKLVLILTLFFITGCSKNNMINCTIEDKQNDFDLKQSIILTFSNDNVKKSKIILDYKIKNKSILDTVKNSAKASFISYKNEKGVSFKESKKNDNYKYEMILDVDNVSDDIKNTFNLNGSNELAIIDKIESNGYKCK